jgi:hypothetical protein
MASNGLISLNTGELRAPGIYLQSNDISLTSYYLLADPDSSFSTDILIKATNSFSIQDNSAIISKRLNLFAEKKIYVNSFVKIRH